MSGQTGSVCGENDAVRRVSVISVYPVRQLKSTQSITKRETVSADNARLLWSARCNVSQNAYTAKPMRGPHGSSHSLPFVCLKLSANPCLMNGCNEAKEGHLRGEAEFWPWRGRPGSQPVPSMPNRLRIRARQPTRSAHTLRLRHVDGLPERTKEASVQKRAERFNQDLHRAG